MPGKTGKKLTKKRKTTPITASAKAAHEQETGKVKIAKKRCHGQTPLRKGPRPTDAERRDRQVVALLRGRWTVKPRLKGRVVRLRSTPASTGTLPTQLARLARLSSLLSLQHSPMLSGTLPTELGAMRLQRLFVGVMFEAAAEEYEREGVPVEPVDFSDNKVRAITRRNHVVIARPSPPPPPSHPPTRRSSS